MRKDRQKLIPCSHLEHGGETLARITLYALTDARFQAEWEKTVRDYADKLCAGLAAARLAGQTEGDIPAFDVKYPIPKDIDPACAYTAFCLAVSGEVARRMEVMMGSDSGGIG